MKQKSLRFRQIWTEIKWVVIAILWILGFVLGYLGFQIQLKTTHEDFTFLDTIYFTLQLIGLNWEAKPGRINWMLQTARLLLPTLTAFTGFQAALDFFRDQTQWLRLWGVRNHVIVCGFGSKARYLVDDLIENNVQVVVIEKNLNTISLSDFQKKGVILINGDATEKNILESARLHRASHLICFLGEDEQNLRVALNAFHLSQTSRDKDLICVLHLSSQDLYELVKKSELSLHPDIPFQLEVFNSYARSAQYLTYKNNTWLQSKGDPEAQPRIMIVGLGHLGQALILQAGFAWHNQKIQQKLHITALDREACYKKETLLAYQPDLSTACELEPFDVDLSSNHQIRKTLESLDNLESIEHIYICLDDPFLNFQLSLLFIQFDAFKKIPIHVRISKDSELTPSLNNPLSVEFSGKRLIPFDLYEQTCSLSLVVSGLHELLARRIRDSYVEGLDAPSKERALQKPWEKISNEEKEANRAQADRIAFLIQQIGYEINILQDWDAENFQFDPGEIEEMAAMEHNLWCEWKRKQGFRYGPTRDQHRRTHPDLVPWDALPEPEKQKNIHFIQSLPRLLSEIGFQIDKASEDKGQNPINPLD